MVGLRDNEPEEGHSSLLVPNQRNNYIQALFIGFSLLASFGIGNWFGRKTDQRIARGNYSQYEAKLADKEKAYEFLRKKASKDRSLLDDELLRSKMNNAQREIALALLRKYGYNEIAEEAVFNDREKNLGNVSGDGYYLLWKGLDTIAEHAKTGYLERIILHKVEPKETLTQISRKYGFPVEFLEEFNSALFNGTYKYDTKKGEEWKNETTVRGMTDVRGFGADSTIQMNHYIAIPVYRRVCPLPPAPPAPENPEEVPVEKPAITTIPAEVPEEK